MKTKTLITTVAVAGALIAGATTVKANAELELISGSSVVLVSPAADYVPYSESVGQWNITVTFGAANLGGPGGVDIDVDSGDTALGYTPPLSPLTVLYTAGLFNAEGEVVGTIGGTTTTSVTDSQWLGATPFALTTLLNSQGTYYASAVGVPTSFSGTATGSTGLTGPYWLTEDVVIGGTTAAGFVQNTTFDANSRIVPDGGTTMVLLGSALACLGAIRSRCGSKRA